MVLNIVPLGLESWFIKDEGLECFYELCQQLAGFEKWCYAQTVWPGLRSDAMPRLCVSWIHIVLQQVIRGLNQSERGHPRLLKGTSCQEDHQLMTITERFFSWKSKDFDFYIIHVSFLQRYNKLCCAKWITFIFRW